MDEICLNKFKLHLPVFLFYLINVKQLNQSDPIEKCRQEKNIDIYHS